MANNPKSSVHIDLSEHDRQVLQRLTREIVNCMRSMQSFQERFGSSAIRKLSAVIVQDPANPDTVQICVDVVSEGPPFEIACWCEPPGVCIEGPCPGPIV